MWKRALQTLLLCSLFLAGMPATADVHCHCDALTCTGGSVPDIPQVGGYFPQQSPAKQAQCHDYCQAQLSQRIADWMANPANCGKTISCQGISQVGTAHNKPPFSVAHDAPACPPPPAPADCCPKFLQTPASRNLRFAFQDGGHGLGNTYTMTFAGTSAPAIAFAQHMTNWAHWLASEEGCPGVAGFRLTMQLYNTNSPTAPSGGALPAGSTPIGGPQVVNLASGAYSPNTFAWTVPESPNYLFVDVNVVPVGRDGKQVPCSKAGDCAGKYHPYAGWIINSVAARIAGRQSGNAAPTVKWLD